MKEGVNFHTCLKLHVAELDGIVSLLVHLSDGYLLSSLE